MNVDLRAGADAISFAQELGDGPDPLALYAKLSDQGARSETMIFEPKSSPTIILERAALRIECRGTEVVLTALTGNGGNLLDKVRRRLECHVENSTGKVVRLKFERSEETQSEERLKAPSPFDVLRAVTSGLSHACDHDETPILAIGILSYDHIDLFEDLPEAQEDPFGFPDYLFWVPESFILAPAGRPAIAICTAFSGSTFDSTLGAIDIAHLRLANLIERCRQAKALDAPRVPLPQSPQVDLDDRAFAKLVSKLKQNIAAGDVYQIVASRTYSIPCPSPFDAYRLLSEREPGAYRFFVNDGGRILFGASPETSVRVFNDQGLTLELKPIAGTRPRGASPDEDNRLEAELRLDPKEQAEHMMLLDLARNDVARVSEPHTRHVSEMMAIERCARVMHLVSSVRGRLRSGLDALDALKACLNMGTLTGAPKIRAMQLLRDAEKTKRGPYGGTIGWLSGDGEMDSAIVIRSALVKHGTAFVRAGAGIVHDSDPMAEAEETNRKASAILSVLAGAMT
jgi:anthranilate synthase component 1